MQHVRAASGHPERGAAIVEFAFILPVFVMLILGMITGGHAYFRKITITDSVREGARFGATVVAEVDAIDAWRTAVKQRVAEVSGGDLDAADVCAELVLAPDLSDPPLCGVADPTGAEGYLVKVSAEGEATLEWLVGSTDLTLRGKAVAQYERDLS